MTHMLNAMLDGTVEVTNLQTVQAYFLQALTWSLGANLLEDGRVKFDEYMKHVSSMVLVEPSVALASDSQYYTVL